MTIKPLDAVDLVVILRKLLVSDVGRAEIVREFQNSVWHGDLLLPPHIEEIVRDLAFDFDHFEPDPSIRREDLSYFGSERLLEMAREAIEEINASTRTGGASSNAGPSSAD
jgi:hypothetical protein